MRHRNAFAVVRSLTLAAALASCSVLEGDKIDYKSAGRGVSLEVPPDLTQLSRDSRYTVPGGPVIPLLAAAVIVWLLSNATRREFRIEALVLAVASVYYYLRKSGARPDAQSGPSPVNAGQS